MSNNKKKVLFIDDEREFCRVFKIYFESEGFEVEIAFNGKDGISIAKEFKPDLILLDVMMPVMDGFEVCRRLKAIKELSITPIIFLTCVSHKEAAKKAFTFGALCYILKPLGPATLLTAINRFLEEDQEFAQDPGFITD
jgi:two-component system alkaline phosphatase synthesis response regulator PhoP